MTHQTKNKQRIKEEDNWEQDVLINLISLGKEYEPYFYYDVMHLGWKGWLYVDEQLTRHYGQAQ